MPHPLCSLPAPCIVQWSLAGSRLVLSVFLLFGGSWVNATDTPAKEKVDPKESLAQLRAYLPTIRCKALFDDERKSVADWKEILEFARTYVEVGLVHQVQVQQVEEEFLRGRLHLLQRDAEYHDSLDQFTHRFKVSDKRRLDMENAAILPLTKIFRQFEKLSSDFDEAEIAALELGRDKDVAKVRPGLIKLLTTSALVKDTSLPNRFRKEWASWEKIKSIEEIPDKLREMQNQLFDLRRERGKQQNQKNEPEAVPPQAEKPKDSPRKDGRSEQELFFACDVGELEFALRVYEAEPLKEINRESAKELKIRYESFRRIIAAFNAVRTIAYHERFERLDRSWPSLSPSRLKEVDLIVSEDCKAEETVTRMLKNPDEQVNGRKKLRQLRILAKSYGLEQRLFVLAFVRRARIRDAWLKQERPPSQVRDGLIGPIVQPPTLPPSDTPQLLDTYRSFSQARQRLLRTWIDYQMVRLDLYCDLGLSPPDR